MPNDDVLFVVFEDQTFERKRIVLDNQEFVRCRFVNCEFLYSGGPWSLEQCSFDGQSKFHPQGAALYSWNLLDFLREKTDAELVFWA